MLKLTGIPCMLPELELDIVLMSAWASTQNTTVSCHQPGLFFRNKVDNKKYFARLIFKRVNASLVIVFYQSPILILMLFIAACYA